MPIKKKNDKVKPKDTKKELEDKTFGMKNKKKCGALKKQYDKITTQTLIEKKRVDHQNAQIIKLVQPQPGPGVDAKTIPCVYFLNKMCTKGDKCKFMHEKKIVKIEEKVETSRLVCRFMLDAMNDNVLTPNWQCPMNCNDIHKLSDISNEQISLEEYIELSRQTLKDEPLLTEETFKAWKAKRKREEEEHKRKKEAIRTGSDLFKEKPDMFIDDEEGEDIDYRAREEENDSEDLCEKLERIDI